MLFFLNSLDRICSVSACFFEKVDYSRASLFASLISVRVLPFASFYDIRSKFTCQQDKDERK